MRLRTSIMQMKQAFFSTACHTERWHRQEGQERPAMEGKVRRSDSRCYCAQTAMVDKRVLIVVGKSVKPLCFKNRKKLPVTYYANSKVWMTSEIFREFLRALDASFGALSRKNPPLCSYCAAYSPDTCSLRNVEVVFYHPNFTIVLQPFDLGLIKCFRQVYKKQLVQRAVV
jgi:hypothetical protein